MAAPFVCSVLLSLQAEGITPSRFLFDFLPKQDRDTPPAPISDALEWVTEHAVAGNGGVVVVKTGSQTEMARFFYRMAEITDEKVFQSLQLRRVLARDKFDRGGVRPVASPARELQLAAQSGTVGDIKPDFIVVELSPRPASWERQLVPAGTEVPREMGILFSREGSHLRAAFLFLDPPR